MRRVPCICPQLRRKNSMSASCCSSTLTMGSNRAPSSLTVRRRPPRWNSSTPYWPSRLRIWVVTVGWLRPSFFAAWVMLPRRATM
ncbi:hypothetical protein D3C72_1956180 [compost metagenome]